MKKIFIPIALFFYGTVVSAQSNNPKYDKALADSLGADQYGMKTYVLVILKTGQNRIDNKERTDSLFRGHLANIGRLANSGQLVVAGPLGKNDKSYRGIFILNVKTIDEANVLLSTDPAIKEKLLEPESFIWYGSAALPLYLKSHERIEKEKI
jgi:uncharacterized protein YciI